MRSLRLSLALVLAPLAGCASNPPAGSAAGAPAASGARAQPLGALAGGARVIVLPTRYLAVEPEVRWWTGAADSVTALADLDAAIRAALRERGVGSDWVWPDAVRRSVARSAGTLTDPARWDATRLRRVRAGVPVGVPPDLHSQLRTLAALNDARYVLYPIDYVVARELLPTAQRGATCAALRLALIDVRAATVEWVGIVSGRPAASYSSALPAGVASRVADLVAPADSLDRFPACQSPLH